MQIVHELGHVVTAWASGGHVVGVVLHPLQISRTDVAPNPSPLLVAWAGPLLGIVLPCAAWGVARFNEMSTVYLFRFFAGFCLIANGAYLAAGIFEPVGDAAEILRLGGSSWTLGLFGLASAPVGFRLWHQLGTSFGLGDSQGRVNQRHSAGMLILCLLLVGGELFWSR